MKKFLMGLLYFLGGFWQLPQHIVAWAVFMFLGATGGLWKQEWYKGMIIQRHKGTFGVSLGFVCFVGKDAPDSTVAHEYGHTVQSRILGPLYLPLVGIFSLLGNLVLGLFGKMADWERVEIYYGLPWEKWADFCGGVNRGEIVRKLRYGA